MPQVQCVRCGAVFYTTPSGGDPCPSCGLIPANSAGASGTWAPPTTPPRDEPSYPSGFGTAAPPSWGAPPREPRQQPWPGYPPAQAWPGNASRPLPTDIRSRPLPGDSAPSYGPYSGTPAPYPGGSSPSYGPYYGPPYGPPPPYPGAYGPPSQGSGWYGPPSMPAPSSQYQVGGQLDPWGAPLGLHDPAGMAPPMVYQYIPDGTPPAPEQESHLGRLAAVIGVAMVIVIALGMVGVVYFGGPLNRTVKNLPTPTATIGPSPTPTAPPLPSGYTLYIDKNGLFSMGIPSEWNNVSDQVASGANVPSGSGFVEYVDEAQGGVLAIAYSPGSTSELDAVESHFFSSTASSMGSGATVSNLSPPSTLTLAGESWTQRSGDITLTSYNETLHLVIIATSHNGHVFLIAYGALQESFTNLNANYFQPALATFTFRE